MKDNTQVINGIIEAFKAAGCSEVILEALKQIPILNIADLHRMTGQILFSYVDLIENHDCSGEKAE